MSSSNRRLREGNMLMSVLHFGYLDNTIYKSVFFIFQVSGRRTRAGNKKPRSCDRGFWVHSETVYNLDVVELVHGVVFTAGFQRSVTGEVLFVSITDVRTSHVLVTYASDTFADLFALYASNVSQHAFFTEVAFCQVVSGQGGSVVGRQGDQVVENTCFTGSILLEALNTAVGFITQLGTVVVCAHQAITVVLGYVFAFCCPIVEYLLTEVQSPVEAWAVVVHQLGIWNFLADHVNHFFDLANVWFFSFNPQQVSTVLQGGDAVQDNAVDTGVFAELEQAAWQTLGLEQLAVGFDDYVAVVDVGSAFNVVAIQEAVVLVAQVAWLVGYSNLLGQSGTQGVGAGNDDAVVNTQLQECVTQCVQLGDEVGVGNGHFTVLVATLLLVGNLVFDLQGTGTSFDHLLGHQVGGFFVTESGVDVGNDGHNVGFEVFDLVQNFGFFSLVAGLAGLVQRGEQQIQLAGISLAQEGVQLFDQGGNGVLLVHGLVGQRTELGAQGSNHPAGQIQVALVGGLQVLFDGDQLLLADKTVPATQGLGVLGWICIVLGHVLAHDVCGVPGDIQTGLEAVLVAHARGKLRVDCAPAAAGFIYYGSNGLDFVLI